MAGLWTSRILERVITKGQLLPQHWDATLVVVGQAVLLSTTLSTVHYTVTQHWTKAATSWGPTTQAWRHKYTLTRTEFPSKSRGSQDFFEPSAVFSSYIGRLRGTFTGYTRSAYGEPCSQSFDYLYLHSVLKMNFTPSNNVGTKELLYFKCRIPSQSFKINLYNVG